MNVPGVFMEPSKPLALEGPLPLPDSPEAALEAEVKRRLVEETKQVLALLLMGYDANPGRTLRLIQEYATSRRELMGQFEISTGDKGSDMSQPFAIAQNAWPAPVDPLSKFLDKISDIIETTLPEQLTPLLGKNQTKKVKRRPKKQAAAATKKE